ncbi:MAG TPA: hypothetical protein DIV47_00195 [Candidatus Pacebacteria bacterium]|nr:hypothetical protein [Candidatus Paceibacterota bacterium]
MEPTGYTVFELRNVLNNDGDTVSLISPKSLVIDSFSYTQCQPQFSWVKNGERWEETSIITPNSPNIFSNTLPDQPTEATNTQATNSTQPSVLGVSTHSFTYPPSVLKPKLSYEKPALPSGENLVFSQPPHLERGALSVIIGGFLLLIPGLNWYAKKQRIF